MKSTVYTCRKWLREAAKGKAKITEGGVKVPQQIEKEFMKELRMDEALSRFEAEFVVPNPQARPSHTVLSPSNSLAREVEKEGVQVVIDEPA